MRVVRLLLAVLTARVPEGRHELLGTEANGERRNPGERGDRTRGIQAG